MLSEIVHMGINMDINTDTSMPESTEVYGYGYSAYK